MQAREFAAAAVSHIQSILYSDANMPPVLPSDARARREAGDSVFREMARIAYGRVENILPSFGFTARGWLRFYL